MGINAPDLPTAADYVLSEVNKNKNILERYLFKINELEQRIAILEKRVSLSESK